MTTIPTPIPVSLDSIFGELPVDGLINIIKTAIGEICTKWQEGEPWTEHDYAEVAPFFEAVRMPLSQKDQEQRFKTSLAALTTKLFADPSDRAAVETMLVHELFKSMPLHTVLWHISGVINNLEGVKGEIREETVVSLSGLLHSVSRALRTFALGKQWLSITDLGELTQVTQGFIKQLKAEKLVEKLVEEPSNELLAQRIARDVFQMRSRFDSGNGGIFDVYCNLVKVPVGNQIVDDLVHMAHKHSAMYMTTELRAQGKRKDWKIAYLLFDVDTSPGVNKAEALKRISGDKLEAIRMIKARTGCSHPEAVQAIEKYWDSVKTMSAEVLSDYLRNWNS